MFSHFHAATALMLFGLAAFGQSDDCNMIDRQSEISTETHQLTINGTIFWIERDKVNWTTAWDKCVAKGGRLAEIPSHEDYFKRIRTFVTQEEEREPHFDHHYGPWIGLNDKDHEGSFRFSNGGQPRDLAKMWGPKQPDNSGGAENCAVIMRSASLNVSINDYGCSPKLSYMCSKVINPVQHEHSKVMHQLYINGITFWIEREKVNWATACDKCVAKGGRLAEIPCYEDYFERIRTFVGLEEEREPHFDHHYGPWIGLNDKVHEGSFRFSNGGQPRDLAKMWGPKQPDNSGGAENCAVLQRSASLNVSINDYGCSPELSYMCSKVVNQVQPFGQSNENSIMMYQLTINDITFWIEREKVNWKTAGLRCTAKGGKLAEIPSYEDYFEHIRTFVGLEEKREPHFKGHFGPWIGLDDRDHEGSFQFPNGAKPRDLVKMWGPKQPDNHAGAEHCAMFMRSASFNVSLNDCVCPLKFSYMCSKQLAR